MKNKQTVYQIIAVFIDHACFAIGITGIYFGAVFKVFSLFFRSLQGVFFCAKIAFFT